jgi:hypothetical protein
MGGGFLKEESGIGPPSRVALGTYPRVVAHPSRYSEGGICELHPASVRRPGARLPMSRAFRDLRLIPPWKFPVQAANEAWHAFKTSPENPESVALESLGSTLRRKTPNMLFEGARLQPSRKDSKITSALAAEVEPLIRIRVPSSRPPVLGALCF